MPGDLDTLKSRTSGSVTAPGPMTAIADSRSWIMFDAGAVWLLAIAAGGASPPLMSGLPTHPGGLADLCPACPRPASREYGRVERQLRLDHAFSGRTYTADSPLRVDLHWAPPLRVDLTRSVPELLRVRKS